MEELKKNTRNKMQNSLDALKGNLSKIRTGRAHTGVLDHINVDYYGSQTALNQVAGVTLGDATTINIQPYEKTMIAVIEKAVRESDLGLNPATSGDLIRVPMPPLTEERRKDLVKQVKLETENCKVSVRNTRQKANDEVKKLSKDGLSEDMARDAESSVQTLTDEYIALTDKHFEDKQKDVMTI